MRRSDVFRETCHVEGVVGMSVTREVPEPRIEDLDWEVDVKKAGEAILEGIPEELRERYRRKAMAAPRSKSAAVYLKCLDCCCWDRKEVQRCAIVGCSLHAQRTRLFRPPASKSKAASEAA
jgi:hypothetical protein